MAINNSVDWQPVYSSLIMILTVFFILLIAYSQQSQKEMIAAKASVEKKGVVSEGKVKGKDKPTPVEQQEDQALRDAEQSLRKIFLSRGMNEAVSVSRHQGRVRLRMAAPLLFSSGQALLHQEDQPVLSEVARLANIHKFGIIIEGHTDEQAINTNIYPSNWELSIARAAHVMQYLKRNGGVSSQQLEAAGFGASRPLIMAGERAMADENRRVDIYLTVKNRN